MMRGRMKAIVIIGLMLVGAQTMARDTYWLPHVTRIEAGILTEIIINNDNLSPGSVWLMSPKGGFKEVVAPARQKIVVEADKLFPPAISDIVEISATLGLDLWVRYSGKSLTEPLTVPLEKEGRYFYRFETARTPSIWQGLALVNLGSEPVTATISYYDEQRRPMGGSALVEEMAPFRKFSTLLADPRESLGEGGWFEIQANQPVLATVLSGGPVEGDKFSMYHHQPLAVSDNRIRFTMTGGFGGNDYELIITPEKTCTESGACQPTQSRNLEAVLGAMDTSRALALEVPQLTQPCPDAFVMEVEIYWNGSRNAFSFHDCSEGTPQQARDFVQALQQIREDVLGL